MKLYKITVPELGVPAQYVSSLQDGVAARKNLSANGYKRADIKQEEINIPTDKVGMLKFLNRLGA